MNKKKAVTVTCIMLGVAVVVLVVILGTKDSKNLKIGFSENNMGPEMSAAFHYFDGESERSAKFKKGKTAVITYSLTQESGKLSVEVTDAKGNIIDTKSGTDEGEISFKVEKTQKYSICVKAEKAKGKYKLSWTEE